MPSGKDLSNPGETEGAFLRDVAVEAIVLVPLGTRQQPTGDGPVRVPVSTVQGNPTIKRLLFTGCQHYCSGVNDDCQWIPEDERMPCLRRRFVVMRDTDGASRKPRH